MKAEKLLTRAAWVFCFVVASSGASPAQTLVNLNLQSTSSGADTPDGAAVLGMSGDYWNNYDVAGGTGPGPITLVSDAVNSTDTSAGITITSGSGYNVYSDSSTNTPISPAFLMDGYGYGQNSALTFTLSGLSAYDGDTFTLVLYGAGNHSGQGATFTLSGTSTASGSTTGANRTIADGVGDAYQEFTGKISGDTLGIMVTAGNASNDNGFGVIDGLQLELQSAPDPSSWGLMLVGLCGLGAVLRARHKMIS